MPLPCVAGEREAVWQSPGTRCADQPAHGASGRPMVPATTEAGGAMTTLTNVRYDLNHGAPRRLLNESLERYAATLPAGAEVLEIGAGHYDHGPLFPRQRIVRFDMDADQEPDIVGDAHAMPIADASFGHALCLSV